MPNGRARGAGDIAVNSADSPVRMTDERLRDTHTKRMATPHRSSWLLRSIIAMLSAGNRALVDERRKPHLAKVKICPDDRGRMSVRGIKQVDVLLGHRLFG